MRQYSIKVNGHRVVCTEWLPEGPPKVSIIGLHGFASNGRHTFSGMAKFVNTASARLVAPDLPGFGKSDHSDHYSLREYADIVSGICTELKLDRAVLIGHSFSAKIAVATILDYPGLFSSYAICNPAGFSGSIEKLVLLADRPLVMKLFHSRVMTRFGRKYFRASVLQSTRFRKSLANISGSFRDLDLDARGYRDRLDTIDVAGLLIWGESDPILDTSVITRVQRQINMIDLTSIPDGGHAPMISKPHQFSDALFSFINGRQH